MKVVVINGSPRRDGLVSQMLGHVAGALPEGCEVETLFVRDMQVRPCIGCMKCRSLGRCVLPARIFEILENTPYGYGGELQLTDAMKTLAREEGMIGVDFEGRRYDMGNKLGILEAIVEVGLSHPETGEAFRAYLREIAKTL